MADEIQNNVQNSAPLVINSPVPVTKDNSSVNGSNVKLFGISMSIRSLIALISVIFFCVFVLMKLNIPESFTMLVSNVIAFYFGAHTTQTGNKNPI